MNSFQTLYQVLMAVAVVVGIAVAFTLVLVAAGALFERDKARATAGSSASIPARQLSPADDDREFVLR
jgi:hypothetical protein